MATEAQQLTADERKVLQKSLDNLEFCDVCGEQIFNDGHYIDWLESEVYVLCDHCYDGQMKEALA